MESHPRIADPTRVSREEPDAVIDLDAFEPANKRGDRPPKCWALRREVRNFERPDGVLVADDENSISGSVDHDDPAPRVTRHRPRPPTVRPRHHVNMKAEV